MTTCAERLQRILAEPLAYLHAQRLHLPTDFEGLEARRALNQIVLEGLELQAPWPAPPLTGVAQLWVRHWPQLPYIAALIGAWRLFPHLARGGALQQLPLSLRRFASCSLGPRAHLPIEPSSAPMQQVEAAGFNSLWSWSEHLPTMLLERLPLQFSPQVVDLHRQWPVTAPDTALFFLRCSMLDSIRTLTDLPVSSDAHMAGEDIVAARRRRTLQRQAQRLARDCVDQAQSDANAVHAQAFQEGYAEGILRSVEDLARGLLESQALGLQLRKELAQAASQLLGDLLIRSEWLEEMLERWLAELPNHTDAVLQVLLPTRCKSRGNELRQRLQLLWPGTLILEYQAQERYVLRLADQLLEFDIETSRQRLEPELLSSLANLPESVRTLDEASKNRLGALCSTLGEARHED